MCKKKKKKKEKSKTRLALKEETRREFLAGHMMVCQACMHPTHTLTEKPAITPTIGNLTCIAQLQTHLFEFLPTSRRGKYLFKMFKLTGDVQKIPSGFKHYKTILFFNSAALCDLQRRHCFAVNRFVMFFFPSLCHGRMSHSAFCTPRLLPE